VGSDALRLAFGTLTAVRVPPPHRVDRDVAGAAMTSAPLAGLLLGGAAAAVVAALRALEAPALLVGAAAVAVLAVLTRGMHLDGLADTADGLGSARPPAEALAVMKRSDIGPFGVVSLVLVVLVDASAAGDLPPGGVAAAVVSGRLVLPLACRRGVPSARPGGLGDTVAGSVPAVRAGAAALVGLALCALLAWGWRGAVAGAVATAAAEAFRRHCVRRLGGVTGDVLGALVELAQLAALVALVLLAP
jgi:adenosylcobinamide-GDP ribazoletransferase